MLMNYYKRSLVDLFTRVQEVRSRPLERQHDCLAIQEDLLRRVIYVEKRIRDLKMQVEESKGLLARKRSATLSKEEARKVKEGIERNRSAIGEYKEILYLLKSVCDALAFIYIPKWDIKPMAFKEDAGNMHGKRGLKHELRLLRKVFEVEGALAILNDLTNSLRYGDLTIISEEFSSPIEVKTGRYVNSRTKRQQSDLQNMIKYLFEDKIEGLYGLPINSVRSSILVPESDCVEVLNKLVGDAYRDGFAFSKVEDGLYYYILLGGHPSGWDIENDKPSGYKLLVEEFEGKNPIFFPVNESKFATQGRCPYTLFIRDPQALFDFYSGRLLVYVILDVDVMRAKFASYGATRSPETAVRGGGWEEPGFVLVTTDSSDGWCNPNPSWCMEEKRHPHGCDWSSRL